MLVSDGDKLLAPCAFPTFFLRFRNSGTSSVTHRSVSSCCRCAVQSTQCPNRGIQCVYLLCQLVPLCLQQRDYLHVFPLRPGDCNSKLLSLRSSTHHAIGPASQARL